MNKTVCVLLLSLLVASSYAERVYFTVANDLCVSIK
ncbi:hypothetical protein Barb6XT_00130 [Bacteroidales bacterium Barb6XT]|nr:hypothetical protein Barb6XT_00130 [Bacteroidales bacterium Barb6XT]